jgi:Cu-processing system permease protein
MDISALMGFTGAVYKQFFNSGLGVFIALFLLGVWALFPVLFSAKTFKSSDF